MSSSRSDGVTQFVFSSVRPSLLHLDVSRKFQGCFKKVSRVFQGCFKGILMVFQESFIEEEVSWMFQGFFMIFDGILKFSRVFPGSFKDVSREFHGCFKEVSRMFQGSFKGVLGKFKVCFKEV